MDKATIVESLFQVFNEDSLAVVSISDCFGFLAGNRARGAKDERSGLKLSFTCCSWRFLGVGITNRCRLSFLLDLVQICYRERYEVRISDTIHAGFKEIG